MNEEAKVFNKELVELQRQHREDLKEKFADYDNRLPRRKVKPEMAERFKEAMDEINGIIFPTFSEQIHQYTKEEIRVRLILLAFFWVYDFVVVYIEANNNFRTCH